MKSCPWYKKWHLGQKVLVVDKDVFVHVYTNVCVCVCIYMCFLYMCVFVLHVFWCELLYVRDFSSYEEASGHSTRLDSGSFRLPGKPCVQPLAHGDVWPNLECSLYLSVTSDAQTREWSWKQWACCLLAEELWVNYLTTSSFSLSDIKVRTLISSQDYYVDSMWWLVRKIPTQYQ